jgi:uncharacterized membrane protein
VLKTLFRELDIKVKSDDMSTKKSFNPEKINQRKRTIGIIAIILLLVITVLAILLHISFLVWVVADLIVAAVANLLLRRVGRTPL